MKFDTDAFISYAHLDNQELIEGQKGWVANFHRALEIRVGQLLGKEPQIWRDPKLKGSDVFEETLIGQLRRVAVLVSILSPRYVKSEWTRRELSEFWKTANEAGGVHVGDKARLFKVLKTPVPISMHPPELQQVLGYEFFKIEPETGRPRELDQVFGPEAQREFWMKVDDVAHDLCYLLQLVQGEPEAALQVITPSAASTETVYLAETTFDLKAEHEAIKRDLQQHGHTVLPSRPLPLIASELMSVLREELARCRLSVYLVGKNYSLVPEGAMECLTEIQNNLAIERGEKGDFLRLLWIPPGIRVEDERQRKFIEKLRMDPRVLQGADLLETPLEDLRTVIHERLKPAQKPVERQSVPTEAGEHLTRVYLICDQRDREMTIPWADFLFEEGFEVIRSVFEGDEAEVREYHEESLRICDAVLIHYGAGNELWLRRKLRELQKSAGYGRARPLRAVAICVAPPMTPEKAQFRTHEAMVISQGEGFSPDPLQPFVQRLKDNEGARAD